VYSPIVLEHFHNPRNVGELPPPCGWARRENPACGDVAEIWLQVRQGRVAEVRFRAFGCPAAVAACSRLTELAQGLPVEEAAALTPEDLVEALGGLPASKRHGAALAVRTLHQALANSAPSSCDG
jgi:nitrogen fixation NifU-like protein